jgi:hypothetical protein
MERAPKFVQPPRLDAKESTPMETRVVICAHTVDRADNDKRGVTDVVDDAVPDIGDIVIPTRHLPDPLPHAFHLKVVPGTREVALSGYIGRSEGLEPGPPQSLRYLNVLTVEQVLN